MKRFLVSTFCALSISLVAAAQTIDLNSTVEGTLFASETTEHTFTGAAGDAVTIGAIKTSGDADLALELYAPDGSLLFSDDDGHPEGFLNPQMTAVPLPTDGDYRVVVTRCSFCEPATSARYTLSVSGAEASASSSEVTIGQTVSGILLANQTTEHVFSASEGDTVTIGAVGTSGDADLAMELYSPDGSLLFSDDDSHPEGVLNPQIAEIPLRTTGEYRIVVTRCSFCEPTTSAAYDLTIVSE